MNDFNNGFYTEQNDISPKVDLKKAKNTFSRIGLALCAIILTVNVAQVILLVVLQLMGKSSFTESSWGMWIASFVPLYLLAIPVGLLIMKKLPSVSPEKKAMDGKTFLIYICIAFFFINIGSYIGTFLSLILSKGTAENALNSFAFDTNPIKVLVMVILAPLIEEYVFRKQIIDKTCVYGEKTAVLFSGLLFGLFHTNMFQFFYAFFVGVLFAYIYVRTGKLIYPVILHGIINFSGSVITPYIASKIDFEALEKIAEMNTTAPTEEMMELMMPMMPALTLLMAYYAVTMCLAIAGFILLMLKKKQISWTPAKEQLPHFSIANTVYMNGGIILFITVTTALTVASVFLN